MPAVQPADRAARKRRGAFYTPPDLVELLTRHTLADIDAVGDWRDRPSTSPVRVLDPACGDGRLLSAIGDALRDRGHDVELIGCDIDANAISDAVALGVDAAHGSALDREWGDDRFDIVIGNPPYLSQMAATTSRGGSSRHGGGPYADVAAEFLALATRLADPARGRISLVLPQSILASRDAGPIREQVGAAADLAWSWWSPDQALFEASVNVCLIGLRRPSTGTIEPNSWTGVVTDRLGIPRFDTAALETDGTIGDRALLNANFRDEYYALVPAVGDHDDGPPLITSGLIDPGRSWWGERSVKFNKRVFERPRVDLSRLEGRFTAWAERKLVPKVLIANQTRRIEAVADLDGEWLPGVPVTTATPVDPAPASARIVVQEIEAVLCAPIAAATCWHAAAGTGLSATSLRLSPALVGAIPWPAGDLGRAVAALADGDVDRCGRAVVQAYGLSDAIADPLLTWWNEGLPARAVEAAPR
jgi:SAM-dependent methyltransferase